MHVQGRWPKDARCRLLTAVFQLPAIVSAMADDKAFWNWYRDIYGRRQPLPHDPGRPPLPDPPPSPKGTRQYKLSFDELVIWAAQVREESVERRRAYWRNYKRKKKPYRLTTPRLASSRPA